MSTVKPELDKNYSFISDIFKEMDLSEEEIVFLNNAVKTDLPSAYQAVIAFRSSKIDEKLAKINLDASIRAETAAKATEKNSKRILILTIVLAVATVIQALIAIIEIFCKSII